MRTDRALWLLLCAAVIGGCASAAAPLTASRPALPADVSRFIERRMLCDHFRGEEPYDAERRADLVRKVETYCRGTDSELARLRSFYGGHAGVQAALAAFEHPPGY